MPSHLIVLRGVLLLSITLATTCVLNGYQASQGQFPFLVLLRINYGRDDAYICGGALVAPRYVITAGHCSFGDTTDVVVGQNNISTIQPSNIVQVVSKKRPKNYGEHFNSNDIAIFTLARDIPWVDGVTEYLKIGVDQLKVGDAGVMVGFGQILSNKLPNSAHYKDIHISKDSDCHALPDYYAPYMHCVAETGIQACFGDSGIPVIQEDSSKRPVLVSMLSYGSARYCGAPDAVQTVAKLSVMIDFIRENTPFGGLTFVATPSSLKPATTTTIKITTQLPTTTKSPTTTTAASTRNPVTTGRPATMTTLRPAPSTTIPKTPATRSTTTTNTPAPTAKTTTTVSPVSSSLTPSTPPVTTHYPKLQTTSPAVTTQSDRVGFGASSSSSIFTYSKFVIIFLVLLL